MSDQPFFSVVIPALNEEKYLPNLLTDLSQQDFSDFEVVVVDGQSEDRTVAKARAFEKKLSLTILSAKKRNVSFQRNMGGKKARGEWIIFMDADNRLPNTFLSDIYEQVTEKNQCDVFTTWIVAESENPVDQSTAQVINLGMEIYHKILNKPAAVGALIGVKRSIFNSHLFDEHQQIFEDSLFVKNIAEDGYIFKVFRQPRYTYSQRRFKKEGTLKSIRTLAVTQLNYLLGNSFEDNNYGYIMQGGTYHEQHNPPFIQKINTFLLNASRKQLEQAKKIINSITDFS